MLAEEAIDLIRLLGKEYIKALPELDEIVNFEKSVIKLDQVTFSKEQSCDKFMRREEQKCEDFSLELMNSKPSSFEHKGVELLKLRHDIDELSNKIESSDRMYEAKIEEKTVKSSALSNQQIKKDSIAAFKLGTLSHFSFKRKTKFGYLMNRKTFDVKTFYFDPENNSTQQQIQERWDLLKTFISRV